MTRAEHIHNVYGREEHPFNVLWQWATEPKTRRERYLRFAALQHWAAYKRDHDRDGETWTTWNQRFLTYRGRRRRLWTRLHQEPSAPGLDGVQVTLTPGPEHWGGGNDVVHGFVEPFMVKRGLPIGSGKRTPEENAAVGGSPTSDHLTTHTTTMARDFPTFVGEDDARALALAMGNPAWQPNSYADFYRVVDGTNFRVQILWGAAIGHSDHVHCGVGR